jgi:hypothetical protein
MENDSLLASILADPASRPTSRRENLPSPKDGTPPSRRISIPAPFGVRAPRDGSALYHQRASFDAARSGSHVAVVTRPPRQDPLLQPPVMQTLLERPERALSTFPD